MISNIFKPYPKYIPTEVEWLGEIPENWKVTRVVELMKLGRGRVISQEDIRNNEGEFSVYSSQTENEGILGYIETYDFEGEYITWTTDGANTGTVFSRSGKFNCTNVCGTMTQKYNSYKEITYLPFLAKFLNIASKRYVRYDLNPKLMNNEMSRIELLLPPLPEQQAIVAFLDREVKRIDSIIAKQTQLIVLLKEKRSALITQAVTKGLNPSVNMKPSGIDWVGEIPENWTVTKVVELMKLGRGRVISQEDIRNNEGEYPVYSSQTENEGILGCIDTYDFDGNYITWTTDGANTGTVFSRSGKFNCTNVCGTMTQKYSSYKKITYLPFLSQFLNIASKRYVRYDINPKLMNNEMSRIELLLPPLPEQKAIVAFLDEETRKINLLLAKIEKQIELLNEYKQSLITHAVTGKIDARGEENA